MGERLTNIQSIRIGDTRFDISDDFTIEAFEVEENTVREYAEDQPILITRCSDATFAGTIRVERIALLKLIGCWQFALDTCPDKRVIHLMKNHRDERVRYKNYNRAMKLIRKIAVKGEWRCLPRDKDWNVK